MNETKAIKRGCKYEEYAVKAYETQMKKSHVNFQVTRCRMFINKQYPFLHATPDFLTSCDCCGLGCGEVKCPICISDGDFDKYVQKKSSCLEKVNGTFMLKRETQLLLPGTAAVVYSAREKNLMTLLSVQLTLIKMHT